MNSPFASCAMLYCLAGSLSAPALSAAPSEPNWMTGENVALGGIISPHFHAHSLYGGSTGDEAMLGEAHHDPNSRGFTQNLEGGFSLRAGEQWEGFTTYALRWDQAETHWEGEFEEWFLKVKDLPGGLEVRAGQYLNRFGLQNTYHPHGFDFIDQHLVSSRFLGEEGLATQGGELTWKLPFESMTLTSLLSVSVGQAVGDHFTDLLSVANWTNLYQHNDFNSWRAGVSFATGDTDLGQDQLYGTHWEYQWRENGLEAGGKYFRWRTEIMHAEQAAAWGGATTAVYGLPTESSGVIEAALRVDFVQGSSHAADTLDERWRLSPSLTWFPMSGRTISLRLQYNFDHSSGQGTNHGLWAQVGFNWGGAEVR